MDDTLFDTNMAIFQKRLPDELWQRINRHRKIGKAVTGTLETGDLNINLGGGPIYEGTVMASVARQVEEFCDQPVRYYMPRMTGVNNRSFHHDRIRQHMDTHIKGETLAPQPDDDTGYLVSFGLCAGLHLLLLYQKLQFKNIVIIEPKPEFLALSMHIMQWQGFISLIEARGGQIDIICYEDAHMASNLLLVALRGPDFSLLDGCYLYQHYEDSYLDSFIKNFNQIIANLPNSMGFVEDEYLMLRHSLKNLCGPAEYIFLAPDIDKLRPLPAFVVGSGPSVDTTIAAIDRNQDRAMIFSGGTGLSVLLQNGLIPDFHCEIENVPDIYDALIRLENIEKLAQLTLIAPTTIDPRVVALFKNVIFYFRDSVVPTRLFATEKDSINLAGPTVTNLACRAGLSMGFPEFLLCGIDLGSTQKKHHHSKFSIYGTNKSEYWTSGAGIEDFDIRIPGNRQKYIYTNRAMLLARMFFERLIAICSGQQFINLGNGAEIAGTRTEDPAKAMVNIPFIPKEKHIADILSRLPRKNTATLNIKGRSQEFLTRLQDWHQCFLTKLEGPEDETFEAFYTRVRPFLQQGQEDSEHSIDAAVRAMHSGSLILMLQMAHYDIRRLPRQSRKAYLLEFKIQFQNQLDEMQAKTRQIILSAI